MKITALRATPLALSFKEPYHWAGRTNSGIVVMLIEIETDEGLIGHGETVTGSSAEGARGLLERASGFFVGESPFDVERLLSQARLLSGLSQSPRFANIVLSGIDMALWDIIGKAAGRPIYQLLGGRVRQDVDYFGFLQGDTPPALAESAARAVSAGYGVIYMKVGLGERADLENVATVRRAIGSRKLRVDANEAWDAYTAVRMIQKLAQYDLDWVEQPTPLGSVEALLHVRERVPVPIAADQGVFTLHDAYEICRRRAADVLVVSPHEAGSILAFKKLAGIAEAAGVSINLHGRFMTGLSDCAQHQVALTLPNLTDGNQIMHQLLVEDIISDPDLTPRHGKLGAVEGCGLGCTLDRPAVERARARYLSESRLHERASARQEQEEAE